MNFPKYKAGPIEYWLAEAFTQFVNGAIDGVGAGGAVGIGTEITTTTTGLFAGMDAFYHMLIALGAAFVACCGSGLKAITIWHKTNPFPNPWPKPTDNTNPPISP